MLRFWKAHTVGAGDVVRLDGERVGVVVTVGLSPYWAEEREGIKRAYVVPLTRTEAQWGDWVLPGEVQLIAKAAAA